VTKILNYLFETYLNIIGKTPPPHLHPNAGAWGYQTTHQHPSQYSNLIESPAITQQQLHHQIRTQQHVHHQQQQHQVPQQHHMGMNLQAGADTAGMNMIPSEHHNQSMNGMMNTFEGSSPYSRYGGFLTTGMHPMPQQGHPQAQIQQHQYINHSHLRGSTTPTNSSGQPTTPTLQQQSTINQTSSNQTMGFPEVQTGFKKC
jgi:hypothetical protein